MKIAAVTVAMLSSLAVGEALHGATLYVAPTGKDHNPGTKEQPLATLAMARDAARQAGAGPHRIILMPGGYFLPQPLELDPRDNGLAIEADPAGQAVLYGGAPVTGWRRDGEKFWSADLPGVKEGAWDFRALVVNGRMPQRARFPAAGTFLNGGTWNLPLLSAVAGYWERMPTHEELTTMPYDPKDIPATLDVKNAEVRLYHMWDESLVGVARNDTQRHALIFSTEPTWPPGALGIKTYVIWNTREGMTEPGRWYLDRTAGRLVYWPLPGEDMAQARIIAPTTGQIFVISGNAQKKVEGIVVRGLTFQATTVPLRPAGFGAGGFEGAISLSNARQCALENVEICNVGGLGIRAQNATDCRIVDCRVHDTGACGIRVNGCNTLISGNHIDHVGLYYPSAAAAMTSGRGLHIWRNEIHDSPYSGIIADGSDHLIEGNLIYRVMREMHDGAAIYGNLTKCTLRGNLVRDVVQFGKGFGASAYYLDEGSRDCTIERNVAEGVPTPMHLHIARNIVIRDNVFIADQDMSLQFDRSAGCTFERNTLFASGKIKINPPDAIRVWNDNRLFHDGVTATGEPRTFTLDDALPAVPLLARHTQPIEVVRVAKAPSLDGEVAVAEWPGKFVSLDRVPSRQAAAGPPVFARFSHDDQFLYVAATATMFEPAKLSTGATWGKDDGVEISLAGETPDGLAVTFVVRGYANGTWQSVADAGAPPDAAARLGKEVRFVAKTMIGRKGGARGWQAEWAFPLAALGLQASPGLKAAFNIAVFGSEFQEWNCWEGTLAESWRLNEAGTLSFQ
jgi:hypothetical protein